MLEFAVTVDTEGFKKSIDEQRDRYEQAFAVSKNMIASLMKSRIETDIAGAGNFGSDYSVAVEVEGDKITATVDGPGVKLFEEGGVVQGKPLLWLPISGTDAEGTRASDYGDQLFSVNRKAGGPPLLFSVKDRAPKYFGVPSVTIPKKFHIAEIRDSVMQDFKEIFEGALNG